MSTQTSVPHRSGDPGALASADGSASPNRLAASATFHCLTGCALGEVAGMFIGTALGWGNLRADPGAEPGEAQDPAGGPREAAVRKASRAR